MFRLLKSFSFFLISMVLFTTVSTLADVTKAKDPKVKKEIQKVLTEIDKEFTDKDALKKEIKDRVRKEIKVEIDSDGGAPVEIIVPVAFFMTFPICMFLFFLFKYRSTREKQITLRAMVENGAQIPPEMFMDGKRSLAPIDRDRKNGILYSLGSIGLIVFLLIMKPDKAGMWSIGLIPLLTGIGYLINWKIAETKSQSNN